MRYIFLFFILLATNFTAKSQLNADFSANITEGCGSLGGVQFSDNSTGNITSWNWDFDNGNSSPIQNPQASFTSARFYTITLIVGDGTAFDTIVKTAYIKVYKNPIANFTFTPTGGCSPLSVNFNSTSTLGDNPISTYIWDFRDGSTSPNSSNPTHTYQVAGTYNPNLQIIDSKGCTDNISLGPITVTQAPVASFTTSGPVSSCDDTLTVNFVNTSTGANLTYLWDFGDNTTSTATSPSHKYVGFGRYTVSLTVTDPNCTDTETKMNLVVLAMPVADFSLTDSVFCVKQPIQFNNTSTDAFTYSWNFGDGTASTSKSPIKSYADSGTYVVRLNVALGNCFDTYSDTIIIDKAIARFGVDTSYNCNPGESVQFVDSSYNASIWSWRIQRPEIFNGHIPIIDSSQNPTTIYNQVVGYFTDTLIVTSQLGCSDTLVKVDHRYFDTTVVNILDSNNRRFDSCFPARLNFNSSIVTPLNAGTYSYTWDLPYGGTFNGPDPEPGMDFNDDTLRKVRVSVISTNGCVASAERDITFGYEIMPEIVLSDSILCYGDTIFFKENSPDSSKIGKVGIAFFSASTFRGETFLQGQEKLYTQFADTGYFNIEYTNDYYGCPYTVTIDSAFYINGPIIRTAFESNCINRNLINFTSQIFGANRFVWDFGDGSFDSTNANPSHQYGTGSIFTYSLTAYNDSNSCPPIVDSTEISLTRPPSPIIYPSGVFSYCLNDSVQFTHNNLTEYDTITWMLDGVVVSVTDSFPYRFTQRGKYKIEINATDFLGCPYYAFKDITVTHAQAVIDFDFLSNCLPAPVIFRNNSILDTTLGEAFFVVNNNDTIFPNDTYTYTTAGFKAVNFFISDSLGCSDSIKDPQAFNLLAFDVELRASSNTAICEGTTLTFRNASNDTSATYVWDFGDGTRDTTKQEYINHTFNSAGIFMVKLIGENTENCEKIDSVSISVDANPVAGFTADTTISNCYPLDVQFTDTSNGQINSWFWRIASDKSVLQNPRYNFDQVGKFDIFLQVTTPNGCTDSVLKSQYIQTNGPTADFIIDKKEGCVNETFTFTMQNGVNVNDFVWDFGDGVTDSNKTTVTHEYKKIGTIYPTLILKDINGVCDVPLLDSIDIFDVKADFSIANDTGCTPHITTFTNTSLGAQSFMWNFGQGFNNGGNTETVNFSTEGRYFISLAIQSNIGCIDTANKFIDVFKTPEVTVFPDTGLCLGDSIQLGANGGGSYLWTPSQFLNNNTIPNPIAFPTNTTLFNLRVTSDENCVKDTTVLVEVSQKPNYNGLRDTSLIIGETVDIDLQLSNNLVYTWTPTDDLSCSDCPNPTFQPLSSRTYYLTIKDRFNCFEINDSIYIEVDEKYSLDVPKAFSPNGDGINDIIFAKGWGLKELIAFKIYNRFGELVFESSDFNKGWDGTYKGKIQNIETYVYTVEALTFGDKVLTKKGNISLLR